MSATATMARPQLVAPRTPKADIVLEAIKTGNFDSDVYHILDGADDRLIADEVVHGVKSGAFVYSFDISGKTTSGISVVGASHLAREFGGLKHRIVASVEKRGSLFKFTSYPFEGSPMQVTCSVLPELDEDPDFYTAVIEMHDIKSGNSIQIEKTEMRFEKKKNGEWFERPHYQVIAQSKAYRNGVLRSVPQDVQANFMKECLRLGKSKDMTAGLIDVKRDAIAAYCAKHGLPVNMEAVDKLTMAQIAGLSEAAQNSPAAFAQAAVALGVLRMASDEGGDQQDAGPIQGQASAEPAKLEHNSATVIDATLNTKVADKVEAGDPRDAEERKAQQQQADAPAASTAPAAAGRRRNLSE